ncbi:MAG: hypothetical protein HYS12_18750, partial [Planctomycetes bacterium]|nr:hypothetical protein [Planctomycetota bacterium]
KGTPFNDVIDANQTAATTLVYTVTVNGVATPTETDTLVLASGVRTVEAAKITADAGDDLIRVNWLDGLGVDASVNSLRFDVDGGPAFTRDQLVVIDDGTDDLTLFRKGSTNDTGSVTVGPGNAEPLEVTFMGIEFPRFLDETGAALNPAPSPAAGPQLVVFKYDTFEFNDDRLTASFLGANSVVNVDPTIDPGPITTPFAVPGDQDWYRVQALVTGTLDFQVFFREIPALVGGRPGLPANGNLNIEVYDSDGTLIAGNGTFGDNDGGAELETAPNQNERVRIPAVQGQTYYLRVFGVTTGINNYNITVINIPPPTPYDLELDDVVVPGTVVTGTSTTVFSGNAALSAVDDFYNGKFVEFLTGNAIGQRAVVLDYTGATRTFTLMTPLSVTPAAASTFQIESTDTGRSQLDNILRDNTPTIFLRLDDAIFLNDLPGNNANDSPPDEVIPIPFQAGPTQPSTAGYAIAVFDEGSTPPQTGTPPQTPLGFAVLPVGVATPNGVYTFTVPTALSDGSHFLSARVQMLDPATPQQRGFGGRSVSLEVVVDTVAPPVFFGLPGVANDGLDPSSDTGSLADVSTFSDRVTSDTSPTFFGTAEANAIIRLYADLNNNSMIDAADVLIAQTVAHPLDGTNQFPGGRWVATSNVEFNDPAYFPTRDGLRRIMVTAEDVPGNVSSTTAPQILEIFVDTQGPQVTNVFITAVPSYDLFDPKPSTAGPTPLINQLSITFRDLPNRVAEFPNLEAIIESIAEAPGNWILKGDHVGFIAIDTIVATLDPQVNGSPATATVVLTFFQPLPDDRYTLTIKDNLEDPAGNNLDGESNAFEPLEIPTFPSGDGVPGGDFHARFTVDSRPEIGTWASTTTSIDINGNGVYDPEGVARDFVNRDLIFSFGLRTDAIFAGNFAATGAGAASGFDKIGAYGFLEGQFRFLLDLTHDGVPDVTIVPTLQINGWPVAGNFNNAHPGDEIGLFDGARWFLDSNGNNNLDNADTVVNGPLRGHPVVGDFDGDGLDDLATYQPDMNLWHFDLANNGFGGVDATLNFGQPGVMERPVAADMNMDGVTDIGLWVPAQVGPSMPAPTAEWYFLVSTVSRVTTVGNISRLNHPFNPVPFGTDLFFDFGDTVAQPLVGNFDPPISFNLIPRLDAIADQTMNHGQDTLPVALHGWDYDKDPITYSARALGSPHPLVAQLGLFYLGEYFTGYHGYHEKWLGGPGGTFYGLFPGGELRKWLGNITDTLSAKGLVATVGRSFYDDPSLLLDPPAPANVRLWVNGNVLTIDPPVTFAGSFVVEASVSDGQDSASRRFSVTVTNATAPLLDAIADQTMKASQDKITLALASSDADGDPLTYSGRAIGSQAYELKEQLGLSYLGQYYTGYHGYHEKWMAGTGGAFYGMFADGALRKWLGNITDTRSPQGLVAMLGQSFYDDP